MTRRVYRDTTMRSFHRVQRPSTRCVSVRRGRTCLLPEEIAITFVVRPRAIAAALVFLAQAAMLAIGFYSWLLLGALWMGM